MTKLAPADELSETLADLARLRLRVAQLRLLILEDPTGHATGRFVRVEVALRENQVFDPALLPPEIGCDPQYHRTRSYWTVECIPIARMAERRPGWPMRRGTQLSMH